MKIEHKLSPAVSAAIGRMVKQMQEAESAFRMALGDAKQAEVTINTIRYAISEQLGIVKESEGLPESTSGYRLSADGLAIIGDVAERASAPSALEPEVLPAPRVNGSGVEYGNERG